jgi:hypothetical protein
MPKPTGLSRDEVKARVRAKVEAEKALPASERIANVLHATHSTNEAQQLLELFRAEVRDEIVADIHRAELPKFPAGETPENVSKVVRAVDVRLAAQGDTAPYWVAKGGQR